MIENDTENDLPEGILVTVTEHDECCSDRDRSIFYGVAKDDQPLFIRFWIPTRFAGPVIDAIEKEDVEVWVAEEDTLEMHEIKHSLGIVRTSADSDHILFENAARSALQKANESSVTPQLEEWERNILVAVHKCAETEQEFKCQRDEGNPNLMSYAKARRDAEAEMHRHIENAIKKIMEGMRY